MCLQIVTLNTINDVFVFDNIHFIYATTTIVIASRRSTMKMNLGLNIVQ